MIVKQKEFQYNITLSEGENIKILINENQVINETVGTGYETKITYNYNEVKLTE